MVNYLTKSWVKLLALAVLSLALGSFSFQMVEVSAASMDGNNLVSTTICIILFAIAGIVSILFGLSVLYELSVPLKLFARAVCKFNQLKLWFQKDGL